MNAKEFLDKYGKDEAERVAEAAGTKYSYFIQLAYGHRRPSICLAERLVEASDDRLDLLALMRNKRAA